MDFYILVLNSDLNVMKIVPHQISHNLYSQKANQLIRDRESFFFIVSLFICFKRNTDLINSPVLVFLHPNTVQ